MSSHGEQSSSSIFRYLGNAPDPQVSSQFAENNQVKINVVNGITTGLRDAYNAIVPGTLNLVVGAPTRAITFGVRTGVNMLFGLPWAAGHWVSTQMESAANWASNGLRLGEGGGHAAAAAHGGGH